MVQIIHTEIEINGPPSQVRTVFLDFASIPEWHTGFTISRDTANPPPTPDIEAGEKINVDASGYKFTHTVLENSLTQFRWLGSLPGIFSGEHVFKFEPSKMTPGGTTLTQSEEFTGLLSFLCGPTWSLGKGTRKQFADFNESLKKRVEGS